MSQPGAKHLAAEGYRGQQILNYYYPATEITVAEVAEL
jgi:peptidoglycan hydrolase-like amidase